MDMALLIPTLAAALLAVMGYFLRRLIASHDALEKACQREQRETQAELTKIRGEYLRYEEFARFQNAIDYKLTKIYDLLVGPR